MEQSEAERKGLLIRYGSLAVQGLKDRKLGSPARLMLADIRRKLGMTHEEVIGALERLLEGSE